TVPASSKEISSLIHNRQETESSWERQPSLAIEENDLDQEEIRITMEKALADGKIKEVKKDPLEFLSYYGLYLNGHFTNAAVVLFAKNPAKFLPQVRVRVSFLPEGKSGDRFIDDRILEGNLFKNIELIQQFFDRHLTLSRTFKSNEWQRSDNYLYPILAL